MNSVFKKAFKQLSFSSLIAKPYLRYFSFFFFFLFIGLFFTKNISYLFSSDLPGIEVDWKLLAELDYISGQSPLELTELDGKLVKIPGFMVPLEDNMKNVTEFLLVPSPQACIHVPPPPSNQMVFIKMEGSGVQAAFGPIWVYGTFHLKPKRHSYGESSFRLSGLKTSPYR